LHISNSAKAEATIILHLIIFVGSTVGSALAEQLNLIEYFKRG